MHRIRQSGREVLVVARDDVVATLRSMLGLAALVLYAGMNLAIAVPSLTVADMLRERFGGVVSGGAAQRAVLSAASRAAWLDLYEFLTGSAEASQAMADIPVQAVLTFWAAALFAPLLCVLVSYDAAATDVQSGRLRFLAVRCRRSSLVLGRWLGRTALVVGVVLVVTLGVYTLIATRGEDLGPGAGGHFLRYALLAAAVVPCWVAVGVLASSLASSSRGGLMLSLVFVVVLAIAGATEAVGPASPTWYKALLYSPATWPRGVAAYGGFATLFVALASLRLTWRDI